MLRGLYRALSTKGRPGRGPLPASRTRTGYRPAVETLEDRRLLAVSFVPDQVLLQFKAGVSDEVRNLVRREAAALGHDLIGSLTHAGDHAGTELLTFAPGRSVEDVIQRLKNNAAVAYAEPNWILTKQVVSNDAKYLNGTLWGMYGDDSPSVTGPTGTTNQYGSQAEKAWAAGNIGSNTVIVGIIDEGIDYNHPDLAANIWTNPFDNPNDSLDNDGNGYVNDTHGWDFFGNNNTIYDGTPTNSVTDEHGTHVAGTIGGVGGNGIGVAGMNWNVQIISGKFLGPNGGYISDAIKAVDYFVNLKTLHPELNIVALNNSWGGGGFSQAMQDAITRAANANILFIAAAGNNGTDNNSTAFYPANYTTTAGASYDSVISVAAIDSLGNKASFSNYGSTTVDLGAPGVGVWSTTPNNTYQSWNGTSMATPHVTGAAALYAAANPGATAAQIKNAILDSARNTPTASLAGKTATGGRLNVSGMASTPGITVSPTSGLVTTENGGAASFTVVLNTKPGAEVTIGLSSSNTTEGTVSAASLTFTPVNWNVAQTVTVTGVNDADQDGNVAYTVVTVAATSADAAYNGLDAADVSVTNIDNDVPGITVSPVSGLITTEAGGTANFSVVLNSQPTVDVTIGLSSSDTTEGTVSAASLTFTPVNWNVAQTVTVTGVDDFVVDGNQVYAIVTAGAVSNDTGYNNLNPADVSVSNSDNDAPKAPLYLTVADAGTVSLGGLAVQNEDIVLYDGGVYTLFFDGTPALGGTSGGFAIDAVAILSDTEFLISVDQFGGTNDTGITVYDEDILKFTKNAGTWVSSMYFDGSDVGLKTSWLGGTTGAEGVDAIELLSDGRILISTKGNFTVSGLKGADEDVIAFTPTSTGPTTAGSWKMYFDGSNYGLGDGGENEDVDGISVDDKGRLYLSTKGNFAVNGLSGTGSDVFTFRSGVYGSPPYFAGSTLGGKTLFSIDLPPGFVGPASATSQSGSALKAEAAPGKSGLADLALGGRKKAQFGDIAEVEMWMAWGPISQPTTTQASSPAPARAAVPAANPEVAALDRVFALLATAARKRDAFGTPASTPFDLSWDAGEPLAWAV